MDADKQINQSSAVSAEVHLPLTKKECREIVTPYAFTVSDDLLGVPLATPMRRAVAMGIDSIIIFGLATASLLFILPVMLYLCWLRFQLKKYGHVVVLLLVTLVLSGTATVAPELISEQKDPAVNNLSVDQLGAAESAQLAAAVLVLAQKECQLDCVKTELEKSSLLLAKAAVPVATAKDLLDELLEVTELPYKTRKALLQQQLKNYQVVTNTKVATAAQPEQAAHNNTAEKPWYMPSQGTQSVIGWVKGILADFGIGFGWAVFYFTAYIHWAHGQTIGKKLCQIRVIQLDGSELSAFAAFSRQGGYGAGFATGLTGFLQVFWDPNRQAIQDKVVSTVVIRLNQPKRPLHH